METKTRFLTQLKLLLLAQFPFSLLFVYCCWPIVPLDFSIYFTSNGNMHTHKSLLLITFYILFTIQLQPFAPIKCFLFCLLFVFHFLFSTNDFFFQLNINRNQIISFPFVRLQSVCFASCVCVCVCVEINLLIYKKIKILQQMK